jgi:hypothetical protein
MKISALRFLFCAFVAIALALNSWAQSASGQIKAARVQNEVIKQAADGTKSPVKNGDDLSETDIVITGVNSSVVMLFANGASIKLGAETRMAIEEFKMDPLEKETKASEMKGKGEPTKSKTALNLSYGEMVGDVEKLNPSSTYSIKTPVGAAGIRGTTFRIVFRPTSDGKAFTFTLSTGEGLVLFTGVTQATGTGVNVPKDQEVAITGEISATGQITITSPVTTQPISSEAKQQISDAVEQVIAQAKQETTFTQDKPIKPPEPQVDPKPPTPLDGKSG